jgi:hypothetical protein
MMGPKTLGAIKEELRAALAKNGKDPIQWLEDRIQRLEKARKRDQTQIELLRVLGHVLDGTRKKKPKPRRSRTKATR